MEDASNLTKSAIIIHYGELGLKGANRPLFIVQLAENIKKMAKPNATIDIVNACENLLNKYAK